MESNKYIEFCMIFCIYDFRRGVYVRTRPGKTVIRSQQAPTALPTMTTTTTTFGEWEVFIRTALNYIWTAYCAMSGNYIAVVTVVVVLLLSFLLPDITQKLHATQDLKSIKHVVNKMSNEVKRAEVACLTVADELCYLQCNLNDDTADTSKHTLQDLSACTSHCMRRTQSEPTQLEKGVGFFRRFIFPNKNSFHKEVTIMSYLYTNSFDDKNNVEQQQQVK